MKLSDAEKLTLAMVCEIHTALNLNNNSYNSKLISDALESDNTWAIDWEYSDVLGFQENIDDPKLTQVVNIMEMWEFLEEGFDVLSAEEKEQLVEMAAPFGREVKFAGFDGNNETRLMGITRFLVNKMSRFQRFNGRDFNSHIPSIAGYLRMYAVFKPWLDNYPNRPLNLEEIAGILNARRHP